MFREQSENTTVINADDAPNTKRLDGTETQANFYRRLAVTNTLKWNGKWRDEKQRTNSNTTSVVGAIACQLELTDHQKEVAHRYRRQIDSGFSRGYGLSTVAATLCGLAGWKDDRSYHPNALRNDWRGENEMANLLRSEDIAFSTYARCWGALENELGVEK